MVTILRCTDREELSRLRERAGLSGRREAEALVMRESGKALAACLFDGKTCEILSVLTEQGAPDYAARAVMSAALGALENAGNKTAYCRDGALRALALSLGFCQTEGGALAVSLPDFVSGRVEKCKGCGGE